MSLIGHYSLYFLFLMSMNYIRPELDYDCMYSKFDLEKHKLRYIDYLEVVISPLGEIKYAIPSHQRILEQMVAASLCMSSMEEYYEFMRTNPDLWAMDYNKYLCNTTGHAMVWSHSIILPDNPTEKMLESVELLKREKLLVL